MWIEHALAPLFPSWALQRIQARMAFNAVAAYEGAKVTRRTRGWLTGSTSANTETRTALPRLRDRCRSLVRDNPYALAAIDLAVAYQVGAGIVSRSNTGDDAFDEQADGVWNEWADETGWYRKQALAARGRAEAGEMLLRLQPLTSGEAKARGMRVPYDVGVYEPDYIDSYREMRQVNGNVVHQGIELAPDGTRVSYWLFHEHPGDTGALALRGLTSSPVPATNVLHLYRQDRAGQIRGVPDLAAVMTRLRMLDDLDDALLEQARVQACLAIFVTSSADGAKAPITGDANAGIGERDRRIRPGQIENLRPGEDIAFAPPPSAQGGTQFARYVQGAIATGAGLTYDLLTGDLSGANYSSLRAGRLAFRRRLQMTQWGTLIPGMVDPVYQRVMNAAVLSGALRPVSLMPGQRWPVKHAPPRFELLDPQAEYEGMRAGIRNGLITWPDAVTELGEDPREQLAEIAAWNKKFDDDAVVFDSDPRRVSAAGLAQDPKQIARLEIAATGPAGGPSPSQGA